MGCNVLDTLYQLNLSLLEVLFVYTIKMSPKERFSLSTYISSLQFIIGLPYSSKSWGNWHILVSGPWSGSTEGPNKLFKPMRSLEIPSIECFHDLCTFHPYFLVNSTNRCSIRSDKNRQGHLVEWVEKSSFACLKKLFEIDQAERNHSCCL